MTQAWESVLAQVQTVVAAVSGISQAQWQPGETQNTNLFTVIYVQHDIAKVGPVGTRRGLSTICVDALKTRTWLPNDMAAIVPLLDLIPLALIAEVSPGGGLFGKTIQTFGTVDITLLPKVEYAEVPLIGYRFAMKDVKVLIDL